MINQVSNELLTKWHDKGMEWGLTTTPVAEADLPGIIHPLYKHVLKMPPPEKILLTSSPQAAWQKLIEKENNFGSTTPISFVWPFLDGHWSSCYYAWAECCRELGVENLPDQALDAYIATRTVDCIYPRKTYCIVSDTPRTIQWQNGQSHCEDGPAVEYSDGCAVFALHGIRVPRIVVETPTRQVDNAWIRTNFLKQANVEVRREIIRRFGIENIMNLLNPKCVDKLVVAVDTGQRLYEHIQEAPAGSRLLQYELLMVPLGDGMENPYLKMENASINNIWHIEAVSPDCRTVREALTFRNGTNELPTHIS